MDKLLHVILKIYDSGWDYKFGLNYTTLNLNDSNDIMYDPNDHHCHIELPLKKHN
jgi:hypothetical protein